MSNDPLLNLLISRYPNIAPLIKVGKTLIDDLNLLQSEMVETKTESEQTQPDPDPFPPFRGHAVDNLGHRLCSCHHNVDPRQKHWETHYAAVDPDMTQSPSNVSQGLSEAENEDENEDRGTDANVHELFANIYPECAEEDEVTPALRRIRRLTQDLADELEILLVDGTPEDDNHVLWDSLAGMYHRVMSDCLYLDSVLPFDKSPSSRYL